MRINEILSANQMSELDEGVWDAVKSGASKVGRGIGAVGQAVGAVAGVPAGFVGAMKKGYNQSAQTIAGGPRVDTPGQAVQGGQQVNPQQAGASGAARMDFNQLTQAIKRAQLTPNQKTQLTQQISGSNQPAAKPAGLAAPAGGASTLGTQQGAGAGAFGSMAQNLSKRPDPAAAAAATRTAAQTTNQAKVDAELDANGAATDTGNNAMNAAAKGLASGTPDAGNAGSNAMSSVAKGLSGTNPGAAPITAPATVAAQATGNNAKDSSGRTIPALQRAAPAPAATNANPNAFKYAESINFHSKFLGRML